MDVTINTDIYIQSTPGPTMKQTDRELSEGDTVQVIEYQPTGSNVWGRLQRGGWIPLLLYPRYFTSWRMETLPPPP
jgi:hypothetical protein